jgi:3-oxoacyl-[acyl-carrier protein] reductase
VLLEDRSAGSTEEAGSIGGAIAREGARVFLAGRTQATLDVIFNESRSAGGKAETAPVDALDEESVDRHADTVAAEGGIDISLNLIAHPYTHGVPFHEMEPNDFLAPVEVACGRPSSPLARRPAG